MFSSATALLPVHFLVASAQLGPLITEASVTAAMPSQLQVELAPSLELTDAASSVLSALSPTPLATIATEKSTQASSVASDATANDTEIEPTAIVPVSTPSIPMLNADLWERVRSGYALPAYDSKMVRQYEKFFTKNPKYLARAVKRGAPYLPYIVKQLEYRGMPTELALLPLVESAYNPFAVSKAKAVGMWQFISSTGSRYGLRQDRWFDGRRDIIDSTQAALNYLEFLHKELDDKWLVAIAAYNGGEHRMRRELDRNRRLGKPENFDNIRVRKETRHYVPKLIALSNIFANPEQFGVTIPTVDFEPTFATIWTNGSVNLKTAAHLSGMTLKEFKSLNPGFKRKNSPPRSRARLLVPVNMAVRVTDAIAASGTGSVASGSLIRTAAAASSGDRKRIVHRVRSGDTLTAIARRYRVYTDELAAWNAMELDDILQLGQRLVIYR